MKQVVVLFRQFSDKLIGTSRMPEHKMLRLVGCTRETRRSREGVDIWLEDKEGKVTEIFIPDDGIEALLESIKEAQTIPF